MYPFFFFNDTATTEIYTLSLHDALPISMNQALGNVGATVVYTQTAEARPTNQFTALADLVDRKSTRLNSSHSQISYAVFCLKKKNQLQEMIFASTNNRTHPMFLHDAIEH